MQGSFPGNLRSIAYRWEKNIFLVRISIQVLYLTNEIA